MRARLLGLAAVLTVIGLVTIAGYALIRTLVTRHNRADLLQHCIISIVRPPYLPYISQRQLEDKITKGEIGPKDLEAIEIRFKDGTSVTLCPTPDWSN